MSFDPQKRLAISEPNLNIDQFQHGLKEFQDQFYIQLGHIKAMTSVGITVQSFSEIMPEIFPENAESAYLFWKQLPIRFHYTYECYENLERMLDWFEEMIEKESGSTEFTFITDVFISTWHAHWGDGKLKIKSEWMVKTNHHLLAETLNNRGDLIVFRDQFMAEWKPIFEQVVSGISWSGIVMPESAQKIVDRIKILTPKIMGKPKLYRNDGD